MTKDLHREAGEDGLENGNGSSIVDIQNSTP